MLFWESLWPAFWPVAALIGLFISLALFDLLPMMVGWLHGLVLLAFALALVALLVRGVRRLSWPTPEAARRRLESDSDLPHRPLEAIDDRLASSGRDHASVSLWNAHRRRMLEASRRLRIKAPRFDLTAEDPFAVRTAVLLLLVVAGFAGLSEWKPRLSAALSPDLAWADASQPAQLDVWINPPAYTGLPPLFLDPAQSDNVIVPTGSVLLAQVQGGSGRPMLTIDEATVEFEDVTDDAYRINQSLSEGTWFAVSQSGKTLGTWGLELIPDEPPTVAFASPPDRTQRSILRLDYEAADDYGVRNVEAIIKRIDRPDEEPLTLSLPLPQTGAKNLRNASYHDLTPHPWAGLAVEIQLVARDALDQVGYGDVARTVLPERIFNHPVARALIELRKELTLDPSNRRIVISGLKRINRSPQLYSDDIVVFLAVRLAERRLLYDDSPEVVGQVQQILWDTALHIEEGELALADRELRRLQEELMKALAEGAPQEEIDRLIEELSRALDNFMEALAQQMQEQLAEGAELQPLPEGAQVIPGDELQKLLERARELARSGARDAAQELLSQLQNMLENLRMAPFAQSGNQQSESAMEMLRNLEDILRGQQELLDRSFRRSQEGQGARDRQGLPQPGEGGSGSQGGTGDDARMQEELRQRLGELMRELGDALGDIPRPLGRAEQAMRGARDALRGDQPGQAFNPQSRAVDQLQQGLSAMVDRFMERFGQNPAQRGQGQVGSDSSFGRDPLGRTDGEGGFEALEGVQIPDEMELRRAGEILNELRRRRGQHYRPSEELEYLDRLLRQF